jgi:hypothetical protein
MAHCGKFDDALWATVANLVIRYAPWWQISDALLATVANLVMHYVPLRQIW